MLWLTRQDRVPRTVKIHQHKNGTFTGIDDPFEEPTPEFTLDGSDFSELDANLNKIVDYLYDQGYLVQPSSSNL